MMKPPESPSWIALDMEAHQLQPWSTWSASRPPAPRPPAPAWPAPSAAGRSRTPGRCSGTSWPGSPEAPLHPPGPLRPAHPVLGEQGLGHPPPVHRLHGLRHVLAPGRVNPPGSTSSKTHLVRSTQARPPGCRAANPDRSYRWSWICRRR